MLRSSVVFLNGYRVSQGSFLGQLSSKNLLLPKLQQIPCRNAQRSRFSPFSNRPPTVTSQLKIPLVFTVATGSCCFLGNHYLGNLVSPRTNYDGTIRGWWNSKPDWFKVYWSICGTCILVCSSFRLAILLSRQFPSYLSFMNRFFVTKSNPETAIESCAQLILSAFCHISPIHLAINMYILNTVVKTLVPEIGKSNFLGAYTFSAVVSGFTSMAYQLIKQRTNGSVGASGAILGLIAMVIYKHPEYKFYILFLPFYEIPARTIGVALLTFDLLGVLRGWNFLDHAGHLGGFLSGCTWELLSKFQKPEDLPKHQTLPKISKSPFTDDSDRW